MPHRLRAAEKVLRGGRSMVVFPEGTRSVTGEMADFLPSLGYLALRAEVGVLPAHIAGTYEALAGRRGYIPRRVPIGVRFGPARCFSGDGSHGRRSARSHVTRRIMDDIAALLP